ncbi:MAG TPA: hypothetical protein VGL62_13565 [Vicinamibacterales bacterium]|jgi:hypothetical protein
MTRASKAKGADWKAVLFAWLVAGTLDITAAITYYPLTAGVRVERLLQGIASGVLGAAAFDGGVRTALLGLALHYLIALIWTVIFFFAARRFPALVRHLAVAAIAYGAVVWTGMTLVVLPLSRVRRGPFNVAQAIIAAVILMICIGLPFAGIVGRHVRAGVKIAA